MGSSLISDLFPETSEKSSTQKEYSSFTEVFEEMCPYFMSIGVTYEQFWYGDFDICKYALKAEKLRNVKKNNDFWWNSLYIFRALLDASPAFHDFGSGDEVKIKPLDRPLPLTQEEAEEREQQKIRENQEMMMDYLLSYAERHNQQLKEERNKEVEDK